MNPSIMFSSYLEPDIILYQNIATTDSEKQ